MSKIKRNYSEEIISRYSRLGNNKDRTEHFQEAVDPVLILFDLAESIKIKKLKNEILKGAILRMVACIEGYVRLAIKDIINDERYKDNILNFNGINNFDLNTLLSLDRKNIELSDLIANLIKINSFSDIESIFKELLGITLTKEIKNKSIDFFGNEELANDFNRYFYEELKQLFTYRHIFAHELATNLDLDVDFLSNTLHSTSIAFLYLTDDIIEEKIETV